MVDIKVKILLFSVLISGLLHSSSEQLFAARQLLKTMSIEQKIGQLFVVASVSDLSLNQTFMQNNVYNLDPNYVEELIKTHDIGGVIFLGKGTKASQRDMTERFQSQSRTPLLIALDAEWGSAMRLTDGFCCEKNLHLAKHTDDEVREIAGKIGCELRELGVHINLAPVADINTNPENPVINVRSFGDAPELVSAKAHAYMLGLHDAGVLSCAKHFPGHGDTSVDSHCALPVLLHSKERLRAVELEPFIRMIEAGVPAVLMGHLAVPAYDQTNAPATLSRTIIYDLLRKELGFKGLIITDGLGMGALADYGKPGELECAALLAGNDILLCPVHVPEAIDCIKQALHDGRLSMQELDEHVLRILCAKERMGLLS